MRLPAFFLSAALLASLASAAEQRGLPPDGKLALIVSDDAECTIPADRYDAVGPEGAVPADKSDAVGTECGHPGQNLGHSVTVEPAMYAPVLRSAVLRALKAISP